MARDRRLPALAMTTLLACTAQAHADSVRCHIVYGGEDFTVDATPTTTPYRVAGQKIGRYFEFRAVYVPASEPAAAINLYVSGVATGDAVPIHQLKFRPPFPANGTNHGFTGLHFVYEPTKGSELQYWCERLP